MISTQYVKLNMVPSGVLPVLYCSQYDIGRPLGMAVYNGSESVDLSSYACTIEATRTDKTPVTAAVTTSGNIGVFATTATMTNQADIYKGKLVLTDGNGKRVASLAFVIVVAVRTMDENAEEIEEDASLYQQYTGTVQTIIASIRADLAAEIANRQAAVSAEASARQAAVSAEASARQAAVSAEATARQTADNALQSAISSEASTRATQDASLQSQIDQLIAPSGEAPSAAEVQNARIGADGVTYPTLGDAIRTQVTDVKSAIQDSFEVYPSVRSTLTAGYINANDNTIVASENFGITAPIAVKKGQIIKLTATGYGTSVGMIATCNANNTSRTTKVRSIDNNEHTYTYTVEEDGYVVCSVKTLYDTKYALSIIIDYYGLFDDVAVYGDILQIVSAGTIDKPIERNISGAYVFADGTVQQFATTFISQSIDLYPGQTLTFNGRGYNRAVAMISEYNSASNTYTPLVLSVDSTDRSYTYTALEKVTVRCSAVYYSSGQNVPYSATITTPDTDSIRISALENKVNAISSVIIQYPQLFDNILCIGDSLTVGYDGSGDTPLVKNYPHFLEKLTDANTTLKAHGGWTAKQIWDGEISTATDLANYDCAIIFLGTNGGLTNTVSTDCNTDYTQNADTNTGCYGKIIGKIKATAPNCKIFCVAGVNDYVRRATTMNPAVRALAEFYSVGLIDVENCIMSDSGSATSAERYLYRPIDGIHYNALGYMTLANLFYDSASAFMGEHRTMYT